MSIFAQNEDCSSTLHFMASAATSNLQIVMWVLF